MFIIKSLHLISRVFARQELTVFKLALEINNLTLLTFQILTTGQAQMLFCQEGKCGRYVFLGKTLNSHTIFLIFTQVYKWVLAILLLGVTLRWTSIPSRGQQKYSQSLHAKETSISSGSGGPLRSYIKDFTFLPCLQKGFANNLVGLSRFAYLHVVD